MQMLVKFRAGKLIKDERALKPDTRKGFIIVAIDDQDMMHFQWVERSSDGATVGQPEIDQAVFPGEAIFEKIDRPGARVFSLKFPAEPDRTLFFWAQEPNTDSDDAYIASVNNTLNSVLDGMEEDTPSSLENPRDPSATPAAAQGGGGVGIGAQQLAAALGSILAGNRTTATTAAPQDPIATAMQMGPPLGEVLKAERIIPLLQSNPTLVERLAPYLPPEHRTAESMVDILNSPHFKHQMDILTQALATGQISTSEFGLGAPAFGIQEFLKAVQREAEKEKKDENEGGASGSGEGGNNPPPGGSSS